MAQIREVRLIDDLDGSPADTNVGFALDGKSYEIDLSNDNAARLRDMLASFVAAARRAGNGRHPAIAPQPRTTAGREQNQAIRDWARQQGMTCNDRGRIPAEVLQAFNEAHQ